MLHWLDKFNRGINSGGAGCDPDINLTGTCEHADRWVG